MKTKASYPTPFQRATCWAALTGLCLCVLVGLIGGLLWGLGSVFIMLEPVLLPGIIAGVLAYLLMPCVRWVQEHVIQKRLPAVVAVMFMVALLLTGVFSTILPPIVHQTNELISKREEIITKTSGSALDFIQSNKTAQYALDFLYDKTRRELADSPDASAEGKKRLATAKDYPSKIAAVLNFYSEELTSMGWRWFTAGTRVLHGALGMVLGIVMIPVFLFYFLLKSEDIANNWHDVLPLRASTFREELVGTLQDINDNIISFVRGQMLVSIIDGVLLGIALTCMGLPYAWTIASVAALLGIIPYIGMISTCIPALVIAWFHWGDYGHVLGVVGVFFGVSQLDGWFIQPKVVGNRVGMHDLTIMFSVLFWSHVLGGIVGALLAVPLTASIKVIFMRYVWSTLTQKKA